MHYCTPRKSIIRLAKAIEGEPAYLIVTELFKLTFTLRLEIRFRQSLRVVLVLSDFYLDIYSGAWAHIDFEDYWVVRRHD
ncbi:hypothetical protein TWF191_010171 [Orbilia oligospora]|uniref:Uncharacterized protein n=1 Tax=Orbilia oligospora TaxID=2813651 RepID=A0A7C8QHW3_ORBOL|nr:hypothetical protein TWF191_010171 [Orbilia oligospora]